MALSVEMMLSLGEAITIVMERHKLTVETLSERAGLHKDTVTAIITDVSTRYSVQDAALLIRALPINIKNLSINVDL